ncbi:hypothetical protein PR202_gb03473 [Eleusine coracana subsp. coracana]|uniref:Secreted protein n=1 Tax=Eleusine coracana subsp. coracana TaxID=191504 RepID=A0AAV5E0E7_ELECO|nr:hypothetical protein PR202_gb03473 [Eleusine coracana subsp. coracana]
MKTTTAKALAGTLSTLLILFFFLILCTSSSLSPQLSSSVLRSRRLLSLQCPRKFLFNASERVRSILQGSEGGV